MDEWIKLTAAKFSDDWKFGGLAIARDAERDCKMDID